MKTMLEVEALIAMVASQIPKCVISTDWIEDPGEPRPHDPEGIWSVHVFVGKAHYLMEYGYRTPDAQECVGVSTVPRKTSYGPGPDQMCRNPQAAVAYLKQLTEMNL